MNRYSSKWKWITVTLLLVTVIVGFSWELLVSKSFEYYLYQKLHKYTDKELVVHHSYRKNNRWILDGVSLCGKSEQMFFNAKRATFDFEIDFWNGHLDLYLTLEEPQIHLANDQPSLMEVLSKADHQGVLSINKHVTVHKGLIDLNEHLYAIDAEMCLGAISRGIVQFKVYDEQEQNHLKMNFKQQEDGSLELDFECVELSCEAAHHFAKHFFPSVQNFHITDGVFHGVGGFLLSPQTKPLIFGEAKLKNFSFEHPPTSLRGSLQEVRFHLEKNTEREFAGPIGSIIFCADETFSYVPAGETVAEIRQLMGGVYIGEEGKTKVVLHGIYDNNCDSSSQLSVDGAGWLSPTSLGQLNLSWKLENDDHASIGVIDINEIRKNVLDIDFDFKGMHLKNEIVQACCNQWLPSIQDIYLKGGLLDVQGHTQIDQNQLKEIELARIQIQHLQGEYLPLEISWGTEKVTGEGQLRPCTKQGLECRLKINNGFLNCIEHPEYCFNHIQSEIHFSNGELKDTYADGVVNQIPLHLELGKEPQEGFKFSLSGKVKKLLMYIPNQKLRSKLLTSFDEDEMIIVADFKKHEKQIEIIGLAKILDSIGQERQIHFGFDLIKTNRQTYNFQNHLQKLEPLAPSLANPLWLIERISLDEQKNRARYAISHGWFQAEDLPLKKYVAPFCVNENKLHLSGFGDIQGSFDHQNLKVFYEARDVVLENDYLRIEAPEVKQNPQATTFGQSKPVYYYNFTSGASFGSMPLVNASYLEKNSKLVFSDIHAEVVFDGYNIHIPNIESFCQGVYFVGELDLIFHDTLDGYFDVTYHIQSLHGKFTQLQDLFSHLGKSLFFLKIPMEGEISMHHDAGYMKFNFNPATYNLEAHFKGDLNNGKIVAENSQLSLDELSLHFEYDHLDNFLEFSDIQGTLLVGEPERVEEYMVVGEKILFSDYARSQASFDIWVGDKKRDVIRLAGKTCASDLFPEENCVEFILDRDLSHFGTVHPEDFHLILKDWWQIQEFRFVAEFKLTSLLQDLKRFSRTGFLFLSRHLLKRLDKIKKAQGNFHVKIEYEDRFSRLDYQLTGSEIAIDSRTFQQFLLKGKKANDTWIIDQLKLDQFSIAADILRKSGSWMINFLGIKAGKSILAGLQGEFFDDHHAILGKVNLLEMDLAGLREWPQLEKVLKDYPLQGQLKAFGEFQFEMESDESGEYRFNTLLNTALKNVEFKDLSFDNMSGISCHYVSDKGVIVRQISTALKTNAKTLANLQLDKIEYDIAQDIFSMENLRFAIPASSLFQISSCCASHFPSSITPAWIEGISNIKQKGVLEGCLSVEYENPHYAVKLNLKDDDYVFFNKHFPLANFCLEYDPCELKITTQYLHPLSPFWVQHRSSSNHLTEGEWIITEKSAQEPNENSLLVKWRQLEESFCIDHAEGGLYGLQFNLKGVTPTTRQVSQCLIGDIHFNLKKITPLLPLEMGKKINDWQINSNFCLNGKWEIKPAENETELFRNYFSGDLKGEDFICKGYRFGKIQSHVEYSPENIVLNDVHFSDSYGNFNIDKIYLNRRPLDEWVASIPRIVGQELTPSLLQKNDISKQLSPKPLVVRELILENFKGTLGKIDSFSAKGYLTFVNPPKKNTLHPLFAIPGEILNRLGLDLSVLNPVIGTIFYEIKNGKFFLTKLKDVYSQGKMSKFYLPHSTHQSFMDFDGNLHIQIKMKHYNLIFKLAELFTVTVQGTLQKPTYTLQKARR